MNEPDCVLLALSRNDSDPIVERKLADGVKSLYAALKHAVELAECKPLPYDGPHLRARWSERLAELKRRWSLD